MSCCPSNIIPFANASETIVDYGPLVQEEYGSNPNVQVYYRENGELVLSDDMNSVSFDGMTITVDHGGPQTGIIKIF
jgi:hypothetical protein